MIDFYWLKSFTEIIQLFIAVIFLVFLKVKYTHKSTTLLWLYWFLFFKVIGDMYGIVNYTAWIEQLLTREVLDYYRLLMAALELAMLASLVLFIRSQINQKPFQLKDLIFFIPAVVIAPINLILALQYDSNLVEMFVIVRLIFIGVLSYLLSIIFRIRFMKVLIVTMLIWNVLWLSEVVLYEVMNVIKESTSWIIFILSELAFTLGLAFFLLQVVSRPKLLKFDDLKDLLPHSLINHIESRLNTLMNEQKLFQDSELTAQKLANLVGVNPNDLTLYLNRKLQKNFNRYVQTYRLEESKRLLSQTDNSMTIEQIMNQSGFKSKSVFNTAFKEETEMTPSLYRKRKLSQGEE